MWIQPQTQHGYLQHEIKAITHIKTITNLIEFFGCFERTKTS